MATIKGILYVMTFFFSVSAIVRFCESRPHPVAVEPGVRSVSVSDLRGGCTEGQVFNVTGIITEEHASVTGDPIAEMETKNFTVRFGFPRHATGVYAGAYVVVQGTCYSSEPGQFVYLRGSKLISSK